jgi:small nuclear ribonucleoprotein E
MTQPINLIFRLWQTQSRVRITLFENREFTIDGVLVGFDEYMNVVLDDAHEVYLKGELKGQKRAIGRILLKGDNIVMISQSQSP